MTLPESGFRIVPHTAEVALDIRGRTWLQFYRNAALGILRVYDSAGRLTSRKRLRKAIRAGTPEQVLVDWLNEIIFLASVRRWLPVKVKVLAASPGGLRAELAGGPMEARVKISKEIKAATFSDLVVKKDRGFWRAVVVLDV